MSRQYGYHDVPSSHLNFPSGMRQEFTPNRGDQSANGGYQMQNGNHRQETYFPSSSREHQERIPSTASLAQFNSPAHNFTQHLRERSPSSSSALLNLLQRYPSARQSVYSGRIYPAKEVLVDRQVFRPADASTGYPLVEVAVPKQTAAEIQRPYPGPPDQHLPSFSDGYSTFSKNRSGGSEYFSNYSQGETPGYGQTFPRSAYEKRDFEQELYQFPRSNYNDPDVGSHLSQRNIWPAALDIDSLLGVAEDTMNKSTAEWKRSFAQMQERFQQSPGPADSFSPGFPGRAPGMLTKSSSHNEIHDRSLLGHAVERAQEAPEFQRSGALNGFWTATVDRRPSSPSIQRLPATLTAAERLQLLHEPIEKSRSYTPAPAVPQRLGSRTALAARREKYLQEANSPPSTPKEVGASQPLSPKSVPNFSDLDSAVQELQNGVRQTGYSLGARHLGGCGRFPTDYNNLSPPRLVSRKYTPSPETVSESSSAYQVPNGLPHPKPKHNIKEQMYQASVQTNFLPRSGLRPSQNFPVPSTGSVASRITEFEKRPGTPTLHIANSHQIPFESGPMSPGNAVFRSKPTIHVDIGPSYHRPSQQANTVFSFDTPSTPKDDSLNRLTERFGTLALQTPVKQRESPKPTFDLNLSGSDASNCSNDSSYGFNNLSVNKALRGLLHNEQDLVASPIITRKPKVPPPSFYFPQGKPVSPNENTAALRRGLEVFRTISGNVINYENMDQLCQAVGLPIYWKKPLFSSILYPKLSGAITLTEFSAFWAAMTSVAHDEAARFVYILTGGKATEIKREHLRPLIHDVILTHPGLAFYRTSVEFHDKYCDVVITRIFWNHRRTWARHITAEDLRRADFLEAVKQLELEEDINKNLRYFSYEHFYVVYCLFWEIDQDHDLKIRPEDLGRHQRGAVTRHVVERIFSRAVSKHQHYKTKEIGLVEFTQFLLADEDKQHPSSIDYWFRIMDEDGDGIISLYDMETYFGGIQEKLSEEGIDCMKFSDVACHLIDAIQPKMHNSFRRSDFMNNKLSPKFFNSFVNFRKFYYQETTEGSEPRLEDASGQELTDWDRFCVEEYEALMEQSEADNVDSYDLYLEDDEETRAGSGTYNELL